MKAKTKLTKLCSFLLSLVMLFSLLPTTALAAGNPDPTAVFVDGGKSFYNNRLYYKKGDQDKNFTGNEGDYIAHYNPATGTLTLNGYSGGSISVGGVKCSDITVVLKGTNTINGSLENAVGGDITVTSSDGGTLSISKTTSGSNSAIGIETGLSSSYTTGNVTIKGNAKVTINMTHNGTSTYEKAYGIFAKENITISENASVDITCATPNNTTGGGNCNGLYAAKDVTIDTNGTIKIDVTNAGKDKDNGYSYGVYHMGTATLTKVGNMEVQWKKEGNSTRYSGGAFTKGATFSDTDHAINEDTTNCYASYRFGTPRKVTAGNGQLTGPGVKYANGSGYFLAGDKVNITPATKKGRSGEEIPFKEWTSSDVMLDKSATTASNSFTVPGKDVTVTATHSPFVGTPTFTPTGTTGTQGTLTFKTVVKADAAYEGFRLVKEGNENNESSYISIRSDTTSTSSPYEYSYEASIYSLNEGNYYVAELLNGTYYLSEKFTVNYTAPVTTYTVSFNANGGTGTMADVTDISGEYTLPANGFTAPDGKQFKAWSVGGVEKAAGDKITVTANTTVTAVWEDIPVVTYTVSFDANGGTGSMADVTGVSGEYTLPANGFTAPAGKQFKAWSVGGVEKAVGDKITVTANTTVTAVWEAIEYNVTVTGGTASVGAGTPITKATMGTTVTLTAGAAPSGKVFDKWEVVSGGITLADANSATTTFTMPAEAVSVKATYKTTPVTTYNLTTQVNGGHGTISASKTGLTAGSTETITFNTEVGYEIDTVTVNGTATSVSGNTLNVTMNENKTVVVTYKAIEYNITVTDGKATIGAGSEISKAAEGTAVTLTANAAPSGKVFDKWEVVSGGITLADANSATTTFTMPAEAVSVKATYKNAPHTHTYNQETVKPEALKTPADCTNNAVYFKSCSCGAISTTDTFAAMDTALGHAYGSDWKYDSTNHWHECSRCHDKKDEAAHDYGSDNVCDTCGYYKTVPHTHNLTLVAAKAATCTTAGNSAYYTCDGCDKWFEDATGSVEITDKTSVMIPAPGHTAGTEWKSDDTNHWHECTVAGCGVIIESTKSAHTAGEWIVDTPATATTAGTKHKECTVCHRVLETQTIPSTGTELKIIAGDNQIYNKASGSDVTITCNGDFAKFTGIKVDGSVVDSSNYTAVSGSTVLTLKASYLGTLTDGSHTITFVYTDGEANTNLTIEAAGSGHTHSYGTEWKNNSDKHWHECSCGNKKDEAVHTASEWITDTEATATTDGAKHKECTVCGYVMETGTIPATGTGHTHNYGSDWKSDSTNHWKECSCGDKKDIAAHDFKWVVDKEATATKKGSKHEECKTCGYKRPAVEIPATGTTTAPTDTTKPNDTTKPGNTNGSEKAPQTGDNSNIFLWFALLFVSVAGVTGITVYNKKKKEHAE